MGMTQKDRDQRRNDKAARLREEDLRLKVRPGTKQALADLMQWAGIEEQGEALTLMIHRLHELGADRAFLLLEVPRHEIKVSPAVERRLELAYRRAQLRIISDG